MAGTIDIDMHIIELAAQSGGVCTRAELVQSGVGASAIDRRIRNGFLRPTHRGVLVVAGLESEITPLHGAVAAAQSSALSHITAGRLNALAVELGVGWEPVHLMVPYGVTRDLVGVILHPRRRMAVAEDLTEINGLPVTSPARTIVDLASCVGSGRLRHIVQTGIRDGIVTAAGLRACFESVARQGVNGVTKLRPIIESTVGEHPIQKSALEQGVADLLNGYGITGFEAQYRPPWYDGFRGIVDFAHPQAKVVLEADGRRWHSREQEMTVDRQRDRHAAAHGWVTIRVTWAEVIERPAATAQDIQAVLAVRSADAA